MDDCIRILGEGRETDLDILLATQIKCHIITNQLTCPSMDESVDGDTLKAPPAVLITAMLEQLGDIRQCLPSRLQ